MQFRVFAPNMHLLYICQHQCQSVVFRCYFGRSQMCLKTCCQNFRKALASSREADYIWRIHVFNAIIFYLMLAMYDIHEIDIPVQGIKNCEQRISTTDQRICKCKESTLEKDSLKRRWLTQANCIGKWLFRTNANTHRKQEDLCKHLLSIFTSSYQDFLYSCCLDGARVSWPYWFQSVFCSLPCLYLELLTNRPKIYLSQELGNSPRKTLAIHTLQNHAWQSDSSLGQAMGSVKAC